MKTSMKKLSNPKDRIATTRLDLSLFPMTAVVYGALAFVEGDLKYGGFNWRVAGVSVSTYVAALLRHVSKWYNGELEDNVTGVPHLASAIACLSVIIVVISFLLFHLWSGTSALSIRARTCCATKSHAVFS